jgi:hypothetical protein
MLDAHQVAEFAALSDLTFTANLLTCRGFVPMPLRTKPPTTPQQVGAQVKPTLEAKMSRPATNYYQSRERVPRGRYHEQRLDHFRGNHRP